MLPHAGNRAAPVRTYNLCLLGYGNVNRALAELLANRRTELRECYGIEWRITGVASRRIGWLTKPEGFQVGALDNREIDNAEIENGESVTRHTGVSDWLRAAGADVLFEATSLNVQDGQPAVAHIRAALECGAHAVTANKGPVVFAYRELRELAAAKGKQFLFESAVMDGVPIFSLFQRTLPAIRLTGLQGILNSTTNVILGGMEQGLSFEQALRKAQELGVAETDATHDIEGWDAAVKVAALVNVLMGIELRPQQVEREGIGKLSAEAIRGARESGRPYKLVCRAARSGNAVKASVRPEQLPITDPMALVEGTSSIICFETDIFPMLRITEEHPGVEATAYGMLADFVRAVKPEQSL